MMESLLKNKMTVFLDYNQILSKYQHGFIKGRSCLTNLLETSKTGLKHLMKASVSTQYTLTAGKPSIRYLTNDYYTNYRH